MRGGTSKESFFVKGLSLEEMKIFYFGILSSSVFEG